MCPVGCGIIVHVEDGKVTKVVPDREDIHSEGFMCPKGAAGLELQYHPDRLKAPLIRDRSRGIGSFREATWDEALDFVAGRLARIRDQHGARAIAAYRGQAGAGLGSIREYMARFMNLLGSPNKSGPGYICRAARSYAALATYGAMTEPGWKESDCGVVWAMSVTGSKGWAGPNVVASKKRGAKLLVVDPIRTEVAQMADIWLRPRYGTDCWLALSVANVIVSEDLYDAGFVAGWCTGWDEMLKHLQAYTPEAVESITGVPADQVRAFARTYAGAPSAYIADGNGIDQHANATQTGRAICLLRSLTGNLDAPGGDHFRVTSPKRPLGLAHMMPQDVKPVGGYTLSYRFGGEIPAPAIIDAILTSQPYPIKAFLVQGSNPAVVVPNTERTREALSRLDLLVVMDIFMTRSAECADVVLPAATYFESTAISPVGTRTRYLRLQSKAVEPLHQARADCEFWFELGRRMGFAEYFPWRTAEEVIDEQLTPAGYTCSHLAEQPVVFPEARKKYLEAGFKTPSKKVELVSSLLGQYGFDTLPRPVDPRSALGVAEDEFPLVCTNWPLSINYTHSAQRNIRTLRRLEPEPLIRLHPEPAAQHQIVDGDTVRIENQVGRLEARCVVTDAVPPEAVTITWGWGEVEPKADIGAMVSGKVTDRIIGAVSSRYIPCRIQKVTGA
jgi:anaerobic selenocysteine-containing dehydrogenase